MEFGSLPILAQVLWHAPYLWPVAAGAAALLSAAVLWLYPAQLGMVPWPWRGVMPGLRLVAMLLLAVSLLKPVGMRLATAEERGAVVMLVDRSRSMGVIDNSRTPAQLVALADGLGKLPSKVRSDAATALAAGLEQLRTFATEVRGAQDDLDYARVSGRDIQLRQKRLTDAVSRYTDSAATLLEKAGGLSQADELVRQFSEVAHPPDAGVRDQWRVMVPAQISRAEKAIAAYQDASDKRLYENDAQVRRACDEIAALSRFALAETALLRPGGVVSTAMKEAPVTGFTLASDVLPVALKHGQEIVTSLNSVPDGDQSDLTAGIARAVAGRAVRAVVLFSDGRQIGGDPTIVSGLTPPGVPVFTIAAAAPDPPHDVSFASVSVPPSVFAGQSIVVKTELRHAGLNGKTVELHCKIGDEPEHTRKIQIFDREPATAEFTARASKADAKRLLVRLWFPKIPGEASADNNQAERWVKVVPKRMKVMLVAGSPTWDFQFVRSAMSRSPEMEVKDVILDPANPRLNVQPGELLQQDVIVLFDVPVAALDDRHWKAIERMAQVTGGSVILVAGDGHLPAEYYKLASTATLLPFRAPFKPAWRVWPGDEPSFHFVPGPDSESLDLIRLSTESDADNPDAAPRRWEQLPGCFRFVQLPELHNDKWKPQVRVLLVEEESRLPVLTEMRLGAGRAFFLGINETWRWRFKVGDRDQEQFWRHLVQHASEDPYFATDGPLSLDTDKVVAEPGETVRVRARIIEETPSPQVSYALAVLSKGKQVADQPLTPTGPLGSGRYTASLTLPAGDYEIRWSVPGQGKKTHVVTTPLLIAATREPELADLSGDRKMLRKIAEASGGAFLTLEQVDRLGERLAAAGDARSRYAEMPLWDSPYLFLLVVGSLGMEWALRKRLGLA